MPIIQPPPGLTVGNTGYPYIAEPTQPTYGRFQDEFKRTWMIIDDYLIFQRYPGHDLFMGGDFKQRNSINSQVDDDDFTRLLQKAEQHNKSTM